MSLRVDRGPVIDATATAIGDTVMQESEHAREIIKQVRDARETLAVRLTGAVIPTMIFSLANASKAIAPLISACPLGAEPATRDPVTGRL